jgi:hypothetical protein
LNIALEGLPDACDKVAWLDADIIFENDDWAEHTGKLLERYVVVQPYDVACWLPPGLISRPSEYSAGAFEVIRHGLAYTQAQSAERGLVTGHWGFAWTARRAAVALKGFYDRFIIGGGDLIMAWGMYGHAFRFPIESWLAASCCEAQISHVRRWTEAFYAEVGGSVYSLNGSVFHLWHGSRPARRYFPRHTLLKNANFDPIGDIARDENGCWVWSSQKPDLHKSVKEYFWMRKEDG